MTKARNGHMLRHVAYARMARKGRRLPSMTGTHFDLKAFKRQARQEALAVVRYAVGNLRNALASRLTTNAMLQARSEALTAAARRFLHLGGDPYQLRKAGVKLP